MRKVVFGVGLCALLFLFLPQEASFAQSLVPNGEFEMQGLGSWILYDGNTQQWIMQYDVDGDGYNSWCWRRKPGTGNNGGIHEQVGLVGGVPYQFSADLAFLAYC